MIQYESNMSIRYILLEMTSSYKYYDLYIINVIVADI